MLSEIIRRVTKLHYTPLKGIKHFTCGKKSNNIEDYRRVASEQPPFIRNQLELILKIALHVQELTHTKHMTARDNSGDSYETCEPLRPCDT